MRGQEGTGELVPRRRCAGHRETVHRTISLFPMQDLKRVNKYLNKSLCNPRLAFPFLSEQPRCILALF